MGIYFTYEDIVLAIQEIVNHFHIKIVIKRHYFIVSTYDYTIKNEPLIDCSKKLLL